MNINLVKEQIKKIKGKNISFKINIGRNKVEVMKGILLEVYPYLFTIKVNNEIKSFSYSDLITKTLIIKELKIN